MKKWQSLRPLTTCVLGTPIFYVVIAKCAEDFCFVGESAKTKISAKRQNSTPHRVRQGYSQATGVFQPQIFPKVFGGRLPDSRLLDRIYRLFDRIRALAASVLPPAYFVGGVVWQLCLRSGNSRRLRPRISLFRPCGWNSSSTILQHCDVFWVLCAFRRYTMEVANAHS